MFGRSQTHAHYYYKQTNMHVPVIFSNKPWSSEYASFYDLTINIIRRPTRPCFRPRSGNSVLPDWPKTPRAVRFGINIYIIIINSISWLVYDVVRLCVTESSAIR